MRLLEILTLITDLIIILTQFWPARSRRLSYAPLVAVTFMVAHLIIEQYRWQMVPAYVLTLVLFGVQVRRWLRPGENRPHRFVLAATITLLLILFLAIATVLPTIFPIPNVAPPSGPYAIGTTTFHIIDESRDEIYTDDPDDKREFVVQIWYPAAPNDEPRALYIPELDVAAPVIAERLGLPAFILNHVNLIETFARVDAPMSDEGAPFPFIVFSHGLRGLRAQNTVLMQELASHGYVVASVDHTFGNILTVFPDGRVVFYDQERAFPAGDETAANRLVGTWAGDVRYLLDEMERWEAESGNRFSGRVDLTRVGTMGHSTGGGTAIEVCGTDDRCQAMLALDGWIEPVSEDIIAAGLTQPTLYLSAPEWLGEDNTILGTTLSQNSAGDSYIARIEGAAHFDFADIPLLSPLTPALGLSGEINSYRVQTIINTYVLAFFNQTLASEPTPLLTGNSPDFPEVDLMGR